MKTIFKSHTNIIKRKTLIGDFKGMGKMEWGSELLSVDG